MNKKIALVITLLITLNFYAQTRVITTAVPFLLISADARAAGIADMGVATSPDAFSQQYNAAKYAFSTKEKGFSVSYTPYLADIANDISLGQVTYFNRLNERSAWAASLRYFGLGDIQLTDENGNQLQKVNPNEFSFDGSYSLRLSDYFAMAVTGKYLRSNLKISDGTTDATPASSFAVDVAGYYQSEEQAYTDFDGRWRAGFAFQNLGPKIKYDNDEFNTNFLPSNLRLGAGFDFIFDEYNKVSVTSEFTKLLVPTPQVTNNGGVYSGADLNGDGVVDQLDYDQSKTDYRNINWVSGVFQSFNDAPDGFSEELKEVTWAMGAEYWYQDSFALRTGYFNESVEKGARKFLTLGAGFKYNTMKIDVSYLFAASKIKNPLENTLRFSLTFNFGDDYDEY